MAKMWTIDKNGLARPGVSMDCFSRFLMKEAKRDPNQKLSMTCAFVRLAAGYGPALATWTENGLADPVLPPQKIKEKGDVLLPIPAGQFLRVVHAADPKRSISVDNPPSGEALLGIGADPIRDKTPAGLKGDLAQAAEAVTQWLFQGDVGQSSLALADHLVRIPAGMILAAAAKSNAPHDDEDAKRCLLLFRSLPASFQDLSKMIAVSGEWKEWLTPTDNGVTPWAAAVERIDARSASKKSRRP